VLIFLVCRRVYIYMCGRVVSVYEIILLSIFSVVRDAYMYIYIYIHTHICKFIYINTKMYTNMQRENFVVER